MDSLDDLRSSVVLFKGDECRISPVLRPGNQSLNIFLKFVYLLLKVCILLLKTLDCILESIYLRLMIPVALLQRSDS